MECGVVGEDGKVTIGPGPLVSKPKGSVGKVSQVAW